MRGWKSIACLLAALFLVASGIALAQGVTQNRTLIVNGQSEKVPVIQVNSRLYVDLEGLARAGNGTLSFAGGQIALTLPGAAATAGPPPAPASNPGFSRGFLKAGIEQMAVVREWHTALATAIQNGFPVGADWLAQPRAQAATNLRLAMTAVSTDSDSSAYQLLTNELQNMATLTDKYLAIRATLTYIPNDALQNDELNQRIVTCGHALASMAASGQFVDDISCH